VLSIRGVKLYFSVEGGEGSDTKIFLFSQNPN
jgi:hypothetical protein